MAFSRAYNATAPLFRTGKKGAKVFDSADPVYTASGAATITAASTGLPNSNGYPGYTRPTGSFILDGFEVGQHVYASGAVSAANGTDGAPKLWRIEYLTATQMGVEGPGSDSITDVAADAAFKLRRVRLFSLANLRSITGGSIPVTLQATTATNLAMVLRASLDDGLTWDALPSVILPDTGNGNAKIIQFFVGYDALLMVYPGASYTSGKIYAA